MKIFVYLGHPAHFHNYKNTIDALKDHGHEVEVLIKKKRTSPYFFVDFEKGIFIKDKTFKLGNEMVAM